MTVITIEDRSAISLADAWGEYRFGAILATGHYEAADSVGSKLNSLLILVVCDTSF